MSRKKNAPAKGANNKKPASGIGASPHTDASSKGLTQCELNELVTKIQEMGQLVRAFRPPVPSASESGSLSESGVSKESVDSAQSALSTLLVTLLREMMSIFQTADDVLANVALIYTCDSIIECLTVIERSGRKPSLRALIEDKVKKSYEFPCLLSVFNQESKKRYKLIKTDYKLGANLPFRIAPNLKFSPQTMVAIYIVHWISERSRDPSSVYRRIEPELEGKAFCAVNSSTWERMIRFHMDYLMAPDERAKEFLRENAQLLDGFNRQVELVNWEQRFQLKGPITEIPQFKSLREKGTDKRVTSETSLYRRVREKVVQSARGLMKDNVAPSPV